MPRVPVRIDDSSRIPPDHRPDRYSLEIRNGKARVLRADGTTQFGIPSTISGMSKLYVVSKESELLYVGVTKQSMSARLWGGLTAKGEHGYWGYKFGKKNQTLDLAVWCLGGSQKYLETIEAEVVFLYRQETGNWPQGQTEIHFHQSTEEHRQLAKRVIDALRGRC